MSQLSPDPLEVFEAAVRRHDLTSAYSDDYRVFTRGNEQYRVIVDMASRLPRDKAIAIWNAQVDKKIAEGFREDWYWRA